MIGNSFTRANLSHSGSGSFPNPFLDVASQNMPTSMRNALYWCLPPGTLIEMEGGQLRAVEDVRTDDKVLTRGLTIEKVKAVSVRQVDEEIVRLELAGYGRNLPLRLTANHNVWRIKTPNLKPNQVAAGVTFEKAEKVPAGKVEEGDYFATPLPLRTWAKPRTHPTNWPEGKSRFSGWLTGMYAAEGCHLRESSGRLIGLRFTLGEDDEKTGVLTQLIKYLENETGKAYGHYTPPSRPDVRLVTAHDEELPDWMVEHVPGLAQTKTLSPAIFGYSDEFLLGLLGGMLDGDGGLSTTKGRYHAASIWTSSEKLARQFQRIVYCVGLTPSVCRIMSSSGFKEDSVGYSLTFTKRDTEVLAPYSIKLSTAKATRSDFLKFDRDRSRGWAVFIRDGYVYHRVRHVKREQYNGPVYNLEVNRDHSYIANGLIVANCEYIFETMGVYRMAFDRVVSYFLTDIEFGDSEASDDEKDKWQEFMRDTLDVITNLKNCWLDFAAYGNSFSSVLVPFKRFLTCPKCGNSYPLNIVYNNSIFQFAWSDMKFVATCPSCKSGSGFRGPWRVEDRPGDKEKQITIKRWSPHEIEILEDYYTNNTSYLWRIPEDYKSQVKQGKLYHLERVTMPLLDAIKRNQMFRFNPDVIYHMKEPTLAGIRNRGWGLPRTLVNFRQIYYVQVLRRYNEAIALDYVIPFRLITPAPRPGTGGGGGAAGSFSDPMLSFNLQDFKSQAQSMLRRRRRDPAGWNILPFPVQYQMLGGDASKLAPVDLIANGTEQLLSDTGIPVDLYKGTLTLQTGPVALRLFEATWQPLVHAGSAWLKWLGDQVADILSWESVKPTLRRVTIADDVQKMMMQLQLFMGQQLSGTTAFKSLNQDWKAEQRRIGEEALYQAQQQAKIQEQMSQAGFAGEMAKGNVSPGPGAGPTQSGPGGAPPGGAPAGGAQGGAQPMGAMSGPVDEWIANSSGPDTPVTPTEMVQAASGIAQGLIGMPESAKDSQLKTLAKQNPVMSSLVKSQLQSIRDKAKTQGVAQMQQQAQSGQGAGQGGGQ